MKYDMDHLIACVKRKGGDLLIPVLNCWTSTAPQDMVTVTVDGVTGTTAYEDQPGSGCTRTPSAVELIVSHIS